MKCVHIYKISYTSTVLVLYLYIILKEKEKNSYQLLKHMGMCDLFCLQSVERLSRITEQVGLPVSSMSQSGRMSLKTLASMALLLGTKDCSTSR